VEFWIHKSYGIRDGEIRCSTVSVGALTLYGRRSLTTRRRGGNRKYSVVGHPTFFPPLTSSMQRIKVNNPFALAPLTLLLPIRTSDRLKLLDFRGVILQAALRPHYLVTRFSVNHGGSVLPRVPTLALFAVTVINL
jgi:hypothetical protein